MKKILTLMVFVLLLSCEKEKIEEEIQVEIPIVITEIDKELLLDLVNHYRTSGCMCGDDYYPPVNPVQWDTILEITSIKHSSYLLFYKKTTNVHRDENGYSPQKRAQDEGYRGNVAENVSFNYFSEEEAVGGWMNSPGHCKNIMWKPAKFMAVSRSENYWVMMLGS